MLFYDVLSGLGSIWGHCKIFGFRHFFMILEVGPRVPPWRCASGGSFFEIFENAEIWTFHVLVLFFTNIGSLKTGFEFLSSGECGLLP